LRNQFLRLGSSRGREETIEILYYTFEQRRSTRPLHLRGAVTGHHHHFFTFMGTSYLAEDNSLLSSQNSVSLVLEASRSASSMLEQDGPAQLLDMEAAQDLDRAPVGCTSITQTGGSHHVQVVF
jgi:hypothetical protein